MATAHAPRLPVEISLGTNHGRERDRTRRLRDHFAKVSARYRTLRELDLEAVGVISDGVVAAADLGRPVRLLDVATGSGRYLDAVSHCFGSDGHMRSRVTFGRIVADWMTTVLPMYRYSTQHNHRHILKKHLVPHFGSRELCDLSRADVQAYVAELTHAGYAPKTIDHIHDVLSAVLRIAVTWGHLQENPAHGVKLPELRTVRPKPVLTIEQATRLLARLDTLPRTLVGMALLTGVRRGELFGVRWRDVDLLERVITVEQAVYDGHFGPPKTRAGERILPLSDAAQALLAAWHQEARSTRPDDLVFATRTGKPIGPNNVLRRAVFPACAALGLPHSTWLTFRRTYSSWSHEKGVPSKVVAQLMGHAKVDTTLTVYTQVMEGSLRAAVETIGQELFTHCSHSGVGRMTDGG